MASPLKERGYRGDDSIESLLYSLATGDKKDRAELDFAAERIFLLHRALTIRDMGTKEMRTRHDTIPEWVFTDKSGKAPFSKGTTHMDRADVYLAWICFMKSWGRTRPQGRRHPGPTVNSDLIKWRRSWAKEGSCQKKISHRAERIASPPP